MKVKQYLLKSQHNINMRYFLITALSFLISITVYSQNISVGASVKDITPDPILPVSGGVGTPHPAHIQKGNLTVRAMVFIRGNEKIAIVGIDNLGWPALLGDESRKLIPDIPPKNILIGSTHTHSAPDAYGFPDENGQTGANQEYLAYCIQQIAAAVNEALANAEPASLKIAVGEAKGKIAYNYYAPKLYDPRCGVIQAISSKDNQVIGTLVNYAIHPEVIGPDQEIMSPDLCGPLYDRIEERAGGVALFMNSAQGGMVTADNRRPEGKQSNTWEECQRIGHLLADEALRIVEPVHPESQPILDITSHTTTFPVTSPVMKQVMDAASFGIRKGDQYFIKTEIALLDIGAARILTIPGEALPNIGYYLKRKMDTDYPFLFGLTNDAFGYILTKVDYDSFDRYHYVSSTSLGEQTGEILIDTCLDLLENHPRKSK